MNLTDRTIKALKPGEKVQVVWGNGGFGVRVDTDGTKTFILEYRFDDVYKMLDLGIYPEVDLESAKKRAVAVFEQVVNKIDPASAEPAPAPPVVEEKPEAVAPAPAAKPEKKPAAPAPPPKPAAPAEPPPLPKPPIVKSQPAPAPPPEKKEPPPTPEPKAPSLVKEGCRILSKSEIKIFWNGLPNSLMPPRSQMALKMLISTAQRCEEVVVANWADFDLIGKVWSVPAAQTINGKKHQIPLTNFTLDLLRKIKEVGGAGGVLFPGGPGPLLDAKSLDGDLRHAQLRMNMGSFTVDDLRQSVISQLIDIKIPPPIVARLVNHPDMDAIEGSDKVTERDIRDGLYNWEEVLKGLGLR